MSNINIPIPQNPIGENFPWRDWFQKLSNKVFGTMASQDSNNINVSGGQLVIGNSPAISGSGVNTTMTGYGACVFNNGSFAIGDAAANIASDGTTVVLNGFAHGNGSSTSNVSVGGSNVTIMPTGGSNFTVPKTGNVIVHCDGILYIQTSTTGTRPTGLTYQITFQLRDGSGSTIASTPLVFTTACIPIGTSSPYSSQTELPFSFDMLQNLPAGNYSLIYANAYSGPVIMYDSTGASVTTTTTPTVLITTNSFWYQVG